MEADKRLEAALLLFRAGPNHDDPWCIECFADWSEGGVCEHGEFCPVAELEAAARAAAEAERDEWHRKFLEQRDACDHHEQELTEAQQENERLRAVLGEIADYELSTDYEPAYEAYARRMRDLASAALAPTKDGGQQ